MCSKINPKADPPTGMVLLKATKDYKKGRTILNYKGNIIARLLQCATIALNSITEQLFPNTMGTNAMPTIFRHLHDTNSYDKCHLILTRMKLHTTNHSTMAW